MFSAFPDTKIILEVVCEITITLDNRHDIRTSEISLADIAWTESRRSGYYAFEI